MIDFLTRCGVPLGLAPLLFCVACSSSGPVFPQVDDDPARAAGVVWFDDGDGVFSDDELPASGVTTRVGRGTQTFFPDAPLVTSTDGGFVHDLPVSARPTSSDYFVEVAFDVPGPDGGTVEVQLRQPVDAGNSKILVAVPELEPCVQSFAEASTGSGSCGELLLPDLVPLVDDFGQPPTQPIAQDSAEIDLTTRPGRVLLRFASATANLGEGPLHMIPSLDPGLAGETPASSRATWQRIWTDGGRLVDRRSGQFVFHPGHDHFHVDGFEQYRLLTPSGEEVAVGEKISFCLIDSLPVGTAPARRGLGVFLDAVCEDAGLQQTLNTGWADYYGAGLDDQWIDVTGVAPGSYLVEIVVDPDNVLVESDEGNNRAVFPVTITDADLDSEGG